MPPHSPCLLSHRRARCQDVLKSDPLSQCQDTAEGERQPQPLRGPAVRATGSAQGPGMPRRVGGTVLGNQCPPAAPASSAVDPAPPTACWMLRAALPPCLSRSSHAGYSPLPLSRPPCRDRCHREASFWGGEELNLPRVPGPLPADNCPVAGAARRGNGPERGTGMGWGGRGARVARVPGGSDPLCCFCPRSGTTATSRCWSKGC